MFKERKKIRSEGSWTDNYYVVTQQRMVWNGLAQQDVVLGPRFSLLKQSLTDST